MNVGEIVIKAKLAVEEFTEDAKDFINKAKEKGKEAGSALSGAFNKAVNLGKGLLSTVGKIALGFGKILLNAGFLTTILGSAGVGALSLAGAFKKIFEENQQIRANIDYLIFAIGKALEPVINEIANIILKIIDFLFKAVQYTAYLIKAWTGKNIFAGASVGAFAESMKDAEKSSKGTAKNAKEINKQLAGFDEMNVLSDSSSAGAGGGDVGGAGGGGAMPTFDLSEGDMEPPKWMVWIKEHGPLMKLILEGIATALLMIKFNLGLLQGVGVFLVLDGLLNLLKDIKKYMDDPSWENFADILRDIGEIIAGIGVILGISFESPLGLILLVIGQVVMVIAGIIKQVKNLIDFIKDPSWDNFFELIKGFFGTMGLLGIVVDKIVESFLGGWENIKTKLEEVGVWIDEKIVKPVQDAWDSIAKAWGEVADWFDENVVQPISDAFQGLWDKVVEIFSPIVDFFSELFGTVVENVGIMRDNIVTIASFIWGKIKEIFGVVAQWVEEKIITPIKNKYNEIKIFFTEKFEKIKAKVNELKENVIQKFTEMKNRIQNVFSPIVDFFGNLWNRIKEKLVAIGTKIGESVGGAFKSVINGILGMIERTLNTPIKAINGLIDKIGKVVPGLSKLNTFSFPRLAKGGIINQPGRGVMVGSAIAGESGREGVIPLTDSQQMALLGEAIGRYITVNNVVPVYLSGRQISREVRISNNESDFEFNR